MAARPIKSTMGSTTCSCCAARAIAFEAPSPRLGDNVSKTSLFKAFVPAKDAPEDGDCEHLAQIAAKCNRPGCAAITTRGVFYQEIHEEKTRNSHQLHSSPDRCGYWTGYLKMLDRDSQGNTYLGRGSFVSRV